VDSFASEWTSDTVPVLGVIIPVEGGGQLNGNFTIVDRDDSAQIGLRATDRTDGLLPPATGKNKGTYLASTGFDGATNNRAEWNYDWHLDLRGTGTSLKDYKLTLEQTFVPKLDITGVAVAGPVDLAYRDVIGGALDNVILYQNSWNPTFFNDIFDVDVEGTYNLKLTLAPNDGGPPLIARIKVIVEDPIP
jgi:hypothetical protein